MRTWLVIFAMLLAAPAMAQSGGNSAVTVNPNALEQLAPGSTPTQVPSAPSPPPARPARPPVTAPQRPAPPAPPKTAMPAVPREPPPPVTIPPLSPPPPAHPTTPPPPAPVLADAPGVVSTIPDGVRITFGPLRSELNPATDSALLDLAHKSPDGVFTVMAYAPGSSDDPSTPRRLSLSRALNARSVLIAQGIPSTRIYVRALGPNNTDGPPDRVDITVTAPLSPAKPSQDGTK